MLDFIARILRSTTPPDVRDWLGEYRNAELVGEEQTLWSTRITYEDRSGAKAVYETDINGNVNHIDVIAQ